MNGSWKIEDAGGGKSRCTYQVEGSFKIFVPGPVASTLLNVNLPAMMAAYHKRIKEVYGK
jgi:ribosome-associated toxin RatA of RatAB toxin-antitoxin module